MAEKLCQVQSAYDLTNLQLNDLATFCTSIAGPPTGTNKNILNVLDYIIKKLDCVNDKVDAIPIITPPAAETPLSLPTCLQYTENGQTVTQLSHRNFSILLGTKVCTLTTDVNNIKNQIVSISNRIDQLSTLNNNQPLVTPNCAYPNIPVNVPVAMNVLLDAVEADLCSLRNAVGNNTQLGGASAQHSAAVCPSITNLSNAQALSKASGTTMAGAYGALGWNSVVTNLSQSIQNLWITVLDIRCVVTDLRNCCGQVDCSKFILDYTVTADATRQNVTLNFVGKMSFPGTGFSNVTGTNASKVTISDGTNSIVVPNIDLVSLLTNSSGLVIPVAGGNISSPLNTSNRYTVTVFGSIVKDNVTCAGKETVKYNDPPCLPLSFTLTGLNVT
jgi:hypothetical protein